MIRNIAKSLGTSLEPANEKGVGKKYGHRVDNRRFDLKIRFARVIIIYRLRLLPSIISGYTPVLFSEYQNVPLTAREPTNKIRTLLHYAKYKYY